MAKFGSRLGGGFVAGDRIVVGLHSGDINIYNLKNIRKYEYIVF